MEVKNSIVFEVKKEERIYQMQLPTGAPLGEAYEVCGTFLDKIVNLINEYSEKMRPKNVSEKDKENEEKSE